MFIGISKGEHFYYEDKRVECVKLSTEYAGVGMYILLPKNATSIQEFKKFGESNYIRKIIYRPNGLTNDTSKYILVVDEEGFEAAGAVAFEDENRIAPSKPYKRFVADKPFHFYVTYASQPHRSKRFETVLFSGQYVGVSP
uniref:Uncharacterized protein n=1 Tax=Romanomermis culicivorax TaxID=13658 RepID=A0A915IST1_ROMCU